MGLSFPPPFSFRNKKSALSRRARREERRASRESRAPLPRSSRAHLRGRPSAWGRGGTRARARERPCARSLCAGAPGPGLTSFFSLGARRDSLAHHRELTQPSLCVSAHHRQWGCLLFFPCSLFFPLSSARAPALLCCSAGRICTRPPAETFLPGGAVAAGGASRAAAHSLKKFNCSTVRSARSAALCRCAPARAEGRQAQVKSGRRRSMCQALPTLTCRAHRALARQQPRHRLRGEIRPALLEETSWNFLQLAELLVQRRVTVSRGTACHLRGPMKARASFSSKLRRYPAKGTFQGTHLLE